MATTTKAIKADAKKTKTDAKRVGTDLKKTADDALGLARTTAENVQKDLVETAGTVKESVQSVFLAGLGALSLAEEEGSKLFKKLVKKGEKVDLPGFGADARPADPQAARRRDRLRPRTPSRAASRTPGTSRPRRPTRSRTASRTPSRRS